MADYDPPEKYLTMQLTDINYDIPPQNLPMDVWSSGQNIRFVDGSTEKFEGEAQVFGTPLFDPNWFQPVGYGANYYWIYADITGIAVTDMSVHSDITPAAGVNGDIIINWNGGLINNLAVMNNGVDTPVWWDGVTTNVMTALPAWPASTTARVIRPYKNYLIGMNMSDAAGDYPDMLWWSDAAPTGSVPASWDYTDPTKDAGRYELSDTIGEVIDGLTLGDAFIVYKRRKTYHMQYVGGQYIFKFRKLYDTIGMLAAGCAAEFNKQHLVLTADDIVVHDGSQAKPKSILSQRMRQWFFDSISVDYYDRSFVTPYYAKREIWVCVPTGSSAFADLALVWNYELDTISLRALPLCRHMAPGIIDPSAVTAWDSDSESWDNDTTAWGTATYSPTAATMLMGDQTNTQFLEADNTDQFDGVNIATFVQRESMPLLDRRNIKLVKGLYPSMTSSGNPTIYIRIGSQMHPKDAIDWSAKLPFVIGTDDKVDIMKKGRYISVRFESEDNINWALDEMTWDIELAERY